MSSSLKNKEQRLSLKDGLQGDIVDSECSTPQGFLYETKFVVLNYLGLVPPDLDPGYSEFDMHYQSSASATPFSVSDDDRSSASGSRRSSDYLSVNTKLSTRVSPKTSPRSRTSSFQGSPAVLSSAASVFSSYSVPSSKTVVSSSHQSVVSTMSYTSASSQDSLGFQQRHVTSSIEVTRENWRSVDSDLCTDSAMDGDDESSQSQPSEGSEEAKENPEIRVGEDIFRDEDSIGDLWETRQRQRHELVEPLRQEVRQAMVKLHEEFKQVVASSDECITIRPSEICPFSNEALVAERISQIGDKIMQQHGAELEKTMRELFGSQSDTNMTYSMFKSLVKQMMKSTVPGWYHLALMLKFTQRMALGLVNKGGQGLNSVMDLAVQYIEENLAQTIIDQGGWDAMTNINLDDINMEVLSELSSRTVSPMPLSSQDSHASQSLEPISPDAGTPVDSPSWKTDQQTHFPSASGDEGLNLLSMTPPESELGQFTHRYRSESRPEDLASLFTNCHPDEGSSMSHSVSSPSNLGGNVTSGAGGLGVTHSMPVFTLHPDSDNMDGSQGSAMDVDSELFTSSGDDSSTVVGDGDGDTRGFESSGERKLGRGKMAAAVGTAAAAAAAGAIFAIMKN